MTLASNEEFARRMLLLARSADKFKPVAIYDPDGDSIEFLVKPDTFYAERGDDFITLYHSQDRGEVIGALVKGMSRFCQEALEKVPGFRVTLESGAVRLEHLFLARLWLSPADSDGMVTLAYRKLIEIAQPRL